MESIKTVLIANRGEIVVRIIKTARRLGIRTVAVYTEPDSASLHVAQADEARLLEGDAARAYIDGTQIITIAHATAADAIIPGYGFLSENPAFARAVRDSGLQFVGPRAETIELFGLKHAARDLAVRAGVPVVPGGPGLVASEEEVVKVASEVGYPVMLKATAGGGGMGLAVCKAADEVAAAFRTVQSRGAALFGDSGVLVERYYAAAHHVEVQVFGDGRGRVVAIGERECSVQRRHQKVVEECPSPFVQRGHHPDLRRQLTEAAVRLTASENYASAGTVEFLVDDGTGDFFFLETNTRLQVEHGVTELCYGVDLVELMLRQADAERAGKGGIDAAVLDTLEVRCASPPTGHAVEVRVYAENPARNHAPSPGLLQAVQWHEIPPGTRIDTWVRPGIVVSPHYDPLLAKILHHAETREKAVREISEAVGKSTISGPPTNLRFLATILAAPDFVAGRTLTTFLDTLAPTTTTAAIDVLAGGAQTLVQDFPGRPTIGRGFGHAGPMDDVAFRVANALVGNDVGREGLEITLTGPDLAFLGDAVVALCGAPVEATLGGDGVTDEFPMWTRVRVRAGQRLTIGKMRSDAGCRAYLAVYGGFPSVAEWFGSKATCTVAGVGGYQGRALRSGDLLEIVAASELPSLLPSGAESISIPVPLRPQYGEHWDIRAMAGPHEEGYLLPEDVDMMYGMDWTVSHNAARGGIRLLTSNYNNNDGVIKKPKWARRDGGEGGSHPSNVIEYGYPIGGLNWTGDEPVLFPADAPDFGGFVCALTVVRADRWKLGQLRPGHTLRFRKVALADALRCRGENEAAVEEMVQFARRSLSSSSSSGSGSDAAASSAYMSGGSSILTNELVVPPSTTTTPMPAPPPPEPALVRVLPETPTRPRVSYRQGGDDYLLVDYADDQFDLNHKCRATALERALRAGAGGNRLAFGSDGSNSDGRGPLISTVGVGNSLMIHYDGSRLPQAELVERLVALEDGALGDTRAARLANRTFRLPLCFGHRALAAATERYMANQRPYAAYLPDNFDFVASCNGITPAEFRALWLTARFVVVGVGFFLALPLALPADPRQRLAAPKANPSRTFTPAGAVAWGGSCLAVYPADSPGGYMLAGMTVPVVDLSGTRPGFAPHRPWLFEDMDVITFYEVDEPAYDELMARFRCGRYHFAVDEATSFDMRAHNELLRETAAETAELRGRRAQHQEKMVAVERDLLARWAEEKKAASAVSMDSVQVLMDDPAVQTIEAPVNANVWKVLVQPGDTLEAGQVIFVLEAMKMEIDVRVDDRLDGARVEMVLVRPNDIVHAGGAMVLARIGTKTGTGTNKQ